jgi:hypothetical protein
MLPQRIPKSSSPPSPLVNSGEPNKSRVRHAADRLKRDKLVSAERDGLMLTSKGKKEVAGAGHD